MFTAFGNFPRRRVVLIAQLMIESILKKAHGGSLSLVSALRFR